MHDVFHSSQLSPYNSRQQSYLADVVEPPAHPQGPAPPPVGPVAGGWSDSDDESLDEVEGAAFSEPPAPRAAVLRAPSPSPSPSVEVQAPSLPDRNDVMLNPLVFHQARKQLKFKPSVDLFASSAHHQLPRYYSKTPDPKAAGIDAFTANWAAERFPYANPPWPLIPAVLRKISKDRVLAIMVILGSLVHGMAKVM